MHLEDLKRGILEFKELIGNSPLVLIGEVPGSGGKKLYDLFSRPELLFKNSNLKKHLNSPMPEDKKKFNEFLSEVASSHDGIDLLKPSSVLCQHDYCRNTDENNRLIYSDTSHLSKYGSRLVIKGLSSEILNKL